MIQREPTQSLSPDSSSQTVGEVERIARVICKASARYCGQSQDRPEPCKGGCRAPIENLEHVGRMTEARAVIAALSHRPSGGEGERMNDLMCEIVNSLADPCDACDYASEAEALRVTINHALPMLHELSAHIAALSPSPARGEVGEGWNEAINAAIKAVELAPVFGKKDSLVQDATNLKALTICMDEIRKLKRPPPPSTAQVET